MQADPATIRRYSGKQVVSGRILTTIFTKEAETSKGEACSLP